MLTDGCINLDHTLDPLFVPIVTLWTYLHTLLAYACLIAVGIWLLCFVVQAMYLHESHLHCVNV